EGKKLFDGISSWWVITHGHCHPRIVDAVRAQAGRVDQVLFANFTHAPAEELSHLLSGLLPPSLTRVFFSDNGSTAVEAALKMALQACAQMGHPERQKFVAFSKAYHGDTVGAMSVSAESLFTRPYRPTLFTIQRAQQPESMHASDIDYVADFTRVLEENRGQIAGVIVEPLIQGAGGMIVWPASALKEIAHLCKRENVFLIFDEVMTGFGRTGSLFALDQLRGVSPDLLCLSKGLTGGTLPLALTVATDEIYRSFLAPDKSRLFFHGHSFTGNAIACAAAVANIKLFREENTLQHIGAMEALHRQRLNTLKSRHAVSGARVCGSLAAFEVNTHPAGQYASPLADLFTRTAMEFGLFLRPLGNTVYLLPPYGSSKEDLHTAWDALDETLSRIHDAC
ncbi:MAG: adenosylmethionine--8-amino-7-oxononanoate transaminase, partial [Bdellovibrionales bacterium]